MSGANSLAEDEQSLASAAPFFSFCSKRPVSLLPCLALPIDNRDELDAALVRVLAGASAAD